MAFRDIVAQARSYRRFRESTDIGMKTLVDIVDAARLVPSSVNLQPLRYAISTSREVNAKIFPHTAWARLLKDWKGPREGERPAAYIVIAGDQAHPRAHQVDLGIAAQTINLLLAEADLTACMLANINAEAIHELMGFPENQVVLLVIGIGAKLEEVVIDELAPGGDTKYWREADGTHHVPKRGLDEILLNTFE